MLRIHTSLVGVTVIVAVEAAAVTPPAEFVAGAETYFVHNPPRTSLQTDGAAVPPLRPNPTSVYRLAMLLVMY